MRAIRPKAHHLLSALFFFLGVAMLAFDAPAQITPPHTPTPTPGAPVAITGKSNASGTGTQRTALVTTASRLAVDVGSATITGTISGTVAATQSGTWSVNAGTGFPTPYPTQAVSGTVAVSSVAGTVAATQSGTWTVQPGNTANTTAWKVDGSAVTQPVSGTVAVSSVGGTVTVTGGLTDTQLRATPVPISGTVTVTDGAGALNVIVDSGTLTTVSAVTAITNALPAGSNVIGHVITDTGSTTAVTGNVTVTQATGTNLHAVVDSGTITNVTTVGTITNPVTVTDGAGALNVIVDSGTVAATESGTWTVQPGNTANTTAWLTKYPTPTTDDLTEASISFAASGDNTVVAGTSSQTIRVFSLFYVCDSNVAQTVKDGASTALTGVMTMQGITLDQASHGPWFTTSASNGFVINLGSAVQCSGRVYYTKS